MTILTEYQKTTLIPEALSAYIRDKETNQAEVARLSKVGAAYVNHILQGKTMIGTTAIKDKYYSDIADFIGLPLEQETWRHFNTANFKLIINQIQTARRKKLRATIDGDTGAGKSYACAMYAQKYPTNTFVVKCQADENSKEFAINIAEVVGVETYGTVGAITKRIAKKLLSLENAILIIDEAEHIEKRTGYINIIKSLSDRLEEKVAFLLCGMDINKILQKNFDKQKQNFRQTASRFSKRERCLSDISEDIANICTELGITNKNVHNWLISRIKDFRSLRNIITDAFEESEKSGEPITTKMLQEIWQ